MLHALTDSFKQWQGNTSDAPRIAILDWREVPTFSEFVLFYDYFRANYIDVRNVDPREVTYTDGKLMHGDYHITLIYKRVLISELIEAGYRSVTVTTAVGLAPFAAVFGPRPVRWLHALEARLGHLGCGNLLLAVARP